MATSLNTNMGDPPKRRPFQTDVWHGRDNLLDLVKDVVQSVDWPGRTSRFRRDHREAMMKCLGLLFSQAHIIRFGEKDSNRVPVDYCVAVAMDQWFKPICGPLSAQEAQERLDMACFLDGMAAWD